MMMKVVGSLTSDLRLGPLLMRVARALTLKKNMWLSLHLLIIMMKEGWFN